MISNQKLFFTDIKRKNQGATWIKSVLWEFLTDF